MKRIHWIALASGLVVILLALLLYAFARREAILQRVISKTIKTQRDKNHLIISIGKSFFTGLSTVELDNISIVPENRDSLMYVRSVSVSVKLFPLITGKVKLSELMLEHGWIRLIKHQTTRNYDFLFNKKDSTNVSHKSDLAGLADRLIEEALYKVPDQMKITDFKISKISDTSSFSLLTRSAEIKDKLLVSSFRWSENQTDWHLNGKIDASSKQIDLKFFADKGSVSIPYLKKRFNIGFSVDTMSIGLNGEDYSGDQLTLNGSCGVRNMLVNHPKISSSDLVIPKASIDAKLIIGSDFLTLDSSSTIHLRELNAHPYIHYTQAKPNTQGKSKTYGLMLQTEMTDAQKFFDSFPQGIFSTLEGIKVSGKLAYRLNFFLDEKDPDHLVFQAGFQKNAFKVLKFGAEDLGKINGSFLYTPYEHGKPMRSRMIGPSNPNYVSAGEISPFLRASVVASEDPNFYSHHGIDEFAFRKVIIIDYKAKSFKRGGSTISMQLVKNVFLSREKTVSRKVEEMLITWLLENAGITSKQRILEVYLNLIEWAPNVYGVGEAAHFYFGKSPAALSLGESIFMTSIIPKPKAYQYSFNSDGSLKSYIKGYYRFISGSMLARGKITAEDTLSMFHITLTGPAARYVIKTPPSSSDSTAADSSSHGNFFDRLINSFKDKDDQESAATAPATAAPDSAKMARKAAREERRKKRKGKFLGIF